MSGARVVGRATTCLRAGAAAALLGIAAAACGDGDGPVGGDGTATITGGEVTTGPEERATLDLSLTSNRTAAGLQVDLVADPSVLPLAESGVPVGRAGGMEAVFQNLAAGRIRVVLFGGTGSATLPAGQGPVLQIDFQTGADAAAGTSAVTLEGARVVDALGEPFDTSVAPGRITVVR